MRPNILIVEDNPDFLEELLAIIKSIDLGALVDTVPDRDSAITKIEDNFYDYIILDLSIPTQINALDSHPLFGYEVFRKARSKTPGTPLLILTGSSAQDFIKDLLREQHQIDIWWTGKTIGNVDFLAKHEFDNCPEIVGSALSSINGLTEVELEQTGVRLCEKEERLVRIFSRKFDGVRCACSPLGGGLSGVKVVRLLVTDSNGVVLHNAVAKLGSIPEIKDEARRYDRFVLRLHPGSTPRNLGIHEFGAGDYAGIFYGLADGYDASAIDWIQKHPTEGKTLVQSISSALVRWSEAVPQTRLSIKQIRRRALRDDLYDGIREEYGLDWTEAFENQSIQTRWGCIHGDMHGLNALISETGGAVVIDYGDVGEGPLSYDPITLELSIIFHPEIAKTFQTSWPSSADLHNWADIDAYTANCPFPSFVKACREWATNIAAGRREFLASAYAYVIRQIKYPETDIFKALALLEAIHQSYRNDT